VPLDLASTWQSPLAVSTFDERLYILDISRQEILKYYPEGENFTVIDNQQTLLFAESADLQMAIDLDLYGADSNLLLVYRDGRVRFYDGQSTPIRRVIWNETDLLERGLNTPLVTPVAGKIVGSDLNASIFIADPGSGRIVQVSRATGQVINQFRATDENGGELFTQMTAFAVAERPLRLFITTPDTLYVATTE
jgi:hypothetical protein